MFLTLCGLYPESVERAPTDVFAAITHGVCIPTLMPSAEVASREHEKVSLLPADQTNYFDARTWKNVICMKQQFAHVLLQILPSRPS
eukprot:1074162-Rhodomonas_salina.1